MLAFSWKVLKDSVPTKQNLFKRHVIGMQQGLNCVLSEEGMESLDHLFVQCSEASRVWLKVYERLSLEVMLPQRTEELYI